MSALDELIAHLGENGGPALVLGVALLLGLRHATDPDHLVAVSTLLATAGARRARRASALGAAWGLGHATTLLAVGLPFVLLQAVVPDKLAGVAEVAVGMVIVALAIRLLVLWRRGTFHAHVHAHGPTRHRHLHRHENAHRPALVAHAHEHELARSLLQPYTVGLVHGVGGSGAVTVLVLATVDGRAAAGAALVTFALASAASMALFSTVLGYTLACPSMRRSFALLAPGLGIVSLAFGGWYAFAAFGGL